ncbi:MAG: DUF885 family protein [Pseudomonadota bacterium]
MRIFRGLWIIAIGIWFLVEAAAAAVDAEHPDQARPALVEIFDAFLENKAPAAWNANFNDPNAPNHGLQDYSKSANKARLKRLRDLRKALNDLNVDDWSQRDQVDFLAVRAQLDAEEFRLRVSRPWARDPGFYVDQLLRFAFVELPVDGEEKAKLERQLAAASVIVENAKSNLDSVARDYALLAIHNLTTADGVGHGHPYRAAPPAGVIGWYDDLRARAAVFQPELVGAVDAAKASIESYLVWLESGLNDFDEAAGVGEAHYDWYLKYAKLMPYRGRELTLIADREWERLMSFYAIAQHRNRALDDLAPADNKEDYERRISETDRHIRAFLKNEDIITIPDYVGVLGFNAPFIERPQGLNFWEQIQFRDPHPDHLHAVIPGHRFDKLVEDNNDHPIRSRIRDGVRVEGWATYLEEAMLQAGVLEERPQVDELIYLFGIFRAARVPADVGMQFNEMTVQEAVDFMRAKTPWLDENVARVDAEIYLRRPPGYGVGYTIGALQMRKLLADYRETMGDAFEMRTFHDDFMAMGRLPISLIRWEMTGRDDEIEALWEWRPIPD